MKTMKAIGAVLLMVMAGSAVGQQLPGLERGFSQDKVYDIGDIDSINTFNGNLTIRIPIGTKFPVNGLSYGLTLTYNAKVWDYRTENNEIHAYPSERSNAGLGWLVSMGRLIPGPVGNAYASSKYESDDGNEHGLDRRLHADVAAPPLIAGITEAAYTHDGTYMRFLRRSSGSFDMESADGTVRSFDSTGMITAVRDRFGNAVNIQRLTQVAGTPCLATGFTSAWKITDSAASERAHYVCFRNRGYPESLYDGQIDRIILAAPSDGNTVRTATYVFDYVSPGVNPGCHSIVTPDRLWLSTPLLNSLQLPDGSTYEFTYNRTGPHCEMGTLESVTLPTRATISYGYDHFPIPTPGCNASASFDSDIVGVRTRTISGPGIATGVWTYSSDLSPNNVLVTCTLPDGSPTEVGAPAEEMMVTVKDPLENVTEHFYSVWPGSEQIESPHGFDAEEYGLPFTRWPDTASEGRLLSRRVYDAAGYAEVPRRPLRSTYLVYTKDDGCGSTQLCTDGNQRITKERTIYHDDGNRTADIDYSDWDGLGHFRSMSLTGTFPSGWQTVYNGYNTRDAAVNPAPSGGSDGFIVSGTYPGSFTAPTLEQAWVLNIAPVTQVTDAGGTAVVHACHDPATGFLRARRVLKGTSRDGSDLLTTLTPELRSNDSPTGNAAAESFYGGDVNPDIPDLPLCEIADSPPATPDYRIDHGYQWGVRRSSQYAGTNFFTLERSIDRYSGLPKSSKDPSGLETLYEYDTSFRLRTVTAPGVAPTIYTYTPASINSAALTPARVDIATQSANSALGVAHKQYDYDALGRPWRERVLMPDGTWSLRETLYNKTGWRISVSEAEADSSGSPAHKTIFGDYDPFGRVGTITTADGKRTTLSYAGVGSLTRTVRVSTPNGEVEAETIENYDRRGRVVSVTEQSDGEVTTNYTWDVTGHLASVRTMVDGTPQKRDFDFDHRGFLTLERHPESGETTYDLYDARGHAQTRTNATSVLTFDYDAAERLKSVSQTGVGLLKEIFYDRPNSGADFSLGKVDYAIRHNRQPVLGGDVPVKETYTYTAPGGRLFSTRTDISTGESFTESYEYNDLGQRKSVTYPGCSTCAGLVSPSRTVTSDYVNGFLTRVAGYTSDTTPMSYHPGGLLRSVTHENANGNDGPAYLQEIDLATRMARPSRISVSNYCEDLAIHPQPADKSVAAGAPANLSVTTAGATSYQWYRGEMNDSSAPLSGQTTSTLTAPVSATTKFWVRIGNGNCTIDSRAVTVTVRTCDSVNITTQPASKVVTSGSPVTFTVVATDPGAHYEWYEGSSGTTTNRVGGDSSHLDIASATAPTSYWVRVFSSDRLCSVDSATATLDICTPPVITVQPQSQSHAVSASGGATLSTSVVATGYNLRYEWYRGTPANHLPDPVATGPTLSVTLTGADPGPKDYYVRVISDTSGCGNPAISQVVTMRLNNCFTFFSSPGDHLAYPGAGTWTLSVRAEGDGAPFTYKWFHGVNGQSIQLGPTTEDIVVGLTGDYDAFWCVVTCSNNSGCQGQSMTTPKSYAWRWGVCPLPPVSVSPATATLTAGTTATFTATVDWPRVTYQWYRGQSGDTRNPLSGETHKTLTVPYGVSTGYWVRVTDECGTHSEDSRTVTVGAGSCIPITIDAHPQSVNIAAGGGATLHAAASSSSSFSYVWFAEGSTTVLGNGASLTVHPAVTTTYYAAASNNCFTAETLRATVHITSCGTINIAQQPNSHAITAGSTAGTDLSVTATSTGGAISYRWYMGTTGDTSQPITEEGPFSSVHVTPTETTSYWVRLTTPSCTVDSATAVVTWCFPPHFQTAVFGASLRLGEWTLMESTAVGTDLQYKWHTDTADGPVVSTERAFWIQPSDTITYVLEVIGCFDTIHSAPIVVTVCTTPAVVTQPEHKAVFPGKPAQLHISAWEANHVPITYQWLDTATGATVGTNSPDFTTPPITGEKRYLVHLQAGVCGADSEEVTVSLCTLPEVIGSGVTLNVALQQNVTLHLPFTPTSGNSYAWYRGPVGNTSDPVGVNSYDYPFFVTASGAYWATVTNPDGCVSRSTAYIVNVCVPSITQQPASILLSPPATSVALSVTAAPAMGYQWYIGEKGDITTPVPGGTTATINVSPTADTRYWVRVTGSCGLDERGAPIGPVDSESALVTVCQPPAITQTTPGPWIVRGSSFGIGVVATGTGLTYQWYTGTSGNTSSPINGATGANYTAGPQNTTSYWVRVTGTCGSVNSATITVSVCMTPAVAAQPQSVSIFSGSSTTLSVTATEATTSPISYQWYRGTAGDTLVPVGTNAATYTTPALTANTDYWVRVSCGTCAPADSQTATVSMCLYAQTIAAPPDVQAAIGQVTRLTGAGAAAGNTYRWYRGASGDLSTPLTDWQSVNYLDVNPTTTTQYWYRLQNGTCVSNSGTVTVNVCVPTITTQPASVMINSGASTTLSVVANTPGLTYQWFTGTSGTTTSPINGATGASVSVSPSAATNYWVRVTGSCGVATNSVTAAVTICQPPAITQTTPGPWIVRGSSFGIGVVASGTSLTYQWYTGTSGNTSSPINGATSANYTAGPQNTTSYWVRVTGTCGSVNSATITVSVCMTPAIAAQPQSVSIFSGSSTTLSVTATEATTSPINYQWYRGAAGDTSVPVGTNAATYATPALTANTNYWVRVSCGTCAPADSQTATVSICANPQIVTSSGDVQTTVGQFTRLTTVAGDSYSWYRGAAGDTTNPLAVGSPYSYFDVAPAVTTQYWAQVTSGTCVSRTNTITVSVCVPQMTQQPQSVTIAAGATTTLTAAANTAGVTYRWYTGTSGNTSSPITGATNPTLAVTPTATTSYWVRATSSCARTVDSATATVTICTPPAITRQPNDAFSYAGYNLTPDVLASGSNLSYQWYTGEAGDTHAPISGATSNVLTHYLVTTTRVWVRVTGQCGTVDSRAIWLSVIPTIQGQPQSRVISSGSGATISIVANANGSVLHYRWLNSASNAVVPGSGDSAWLVLTNVTAPISVYCAVTSGTATVYSAQADITLCSGPSVTMSWGYSGACRMIYANITGDYSQIEWFRGQPGDVSSPLGTGPASLLVCPTAPTTYWCRVYGTDPGSGTACNTDSPPVTVSP